MLVVAATKFETKSAITRFVHVYSGGASYGAKGLKSLQFLLQFLQNFCVKQYIVSIVLRSIFLPTKIKIAVAGCHILRLG